MQGWDVMVGYASRLCGAERFQSPFPQPGECLRAGYLVAIQAVYIQLYRAVGKDIHNVLVPDFFE
jgi:hypothetical protein